MITADDGSVHRRTDEELDAEFEQAVAKLRAERLAVTAETAPAAVDAFIDTVLAGNPARRGSREWRLEVCAIAAHILPGHRKQFGATHPLTQEWEAVLKDTSDALFKDNVDRAINQA